MKNSTDTFATRVFRRSTAAAEGGRYFFNRLLSIDVAAGSPPPVPVAFELGIQAAGRDLETECTLGPCWDRYSGSPLLAWGVTERGGVQGKVWVSPFDESEIYVVLRASRDVARQTADLMQIWHGELRFGPFPVVHVEPEGAASPGTP